MEFGVAPTTPVMLATSGSTPPHAPAPARYNPHSNRGRKKQTGESSSLRAQQMRDAQRALRARKQDYLLDLESKVKVLTSENTQLKLQVQALQNEQRQQQQQQHHHHHQSPAAAVTLSLPSHPSLDINNFDFSLPCLPNGMPCFNPTCMSQIETLQLQVLQLQAQLSMVMMPIPPLPSDVGVSHVASLSDLGVSPAVGIPAVSDHLHQQQQRQYGDSMESQLQNHSLSIKSSNTPSPFITRTDDYTPSNHSPDWLLDTDNEGDGGTGNGGASGAPSAEDLFGPTVFEPYLARMKALESLRNVKAVDRSFELHVRQFRARDVRTCRSLLLKAIREQMRIHDNCSLADTRACIEIISEFSLVHKQHINHVRELCRSSTGVPKSILNIAIPRNETKVLLFRNRLRGIPSLAAAGDQIDMLCGFWLREGEFTDEEFFHFNHMMISLSSLCETIEDKMRFWMVLDFLRHNNSGSEVDELLAGVEAVTI
ncbi:hypothetical protein HDU82_000067 [Entophlyctis luteolus]|nr:hypothetical protein HDU82_000067 [Entophlyctis luteolus]